MFKCDLNCSEYFQIFKIPIEKALIHGSSILVALGYTEKNNDLDLVLEKSEFERLKQDPRIKKVYVSIAKKYMYRTEDNMFEFSDCFEGVCFDELYKDHIDIGGYQFINPKRILHLYEVELKRPKDKEKIEFLKKSLSALNRRTMTLQFLDLIYSPNQGNPKCNVY